MSGLYTTRQTHAASEPLGVQLRQLRKQIKVPLWVPAAAAKMDSTLLSKIETGKRLPTPEQLAALTRYFKVPVEPLETRRLAEEMLKSYGAHPGFGAASAIVREEAGEYPVKKRSTEVSKRTKPVDKPKKMK